MFNIAGTIVINPEREARARELIAVLVAATRAEPGNVSYEYFLALDDPGRFHFFEEWETQEAIDAHNASTHLADFMAAAGELEISHVEINQYEVASKTRIM